MAVKQPDIIPVNKNGLVGVCDNREPDMEKLCIQTEPESVQAGGVTDGIQNHRRFGRGPGGGMEPGRGRRFRRKNLRGCDYTGRKKKSEDGKQDQEFSEHYGYLSDWNREQAYPELRFGFVKRKVRDTRKKEPKISALT